MPSPQGLIALSKPKNLHLFRGALFQSVSWLYYKVQKTFGRFDHINPGCHIS